MISIAINLIRKALTFIVDQLQQIMELWNSKRKFEQQPRRMLGEIGVALSILGTSHQIIAPILGGGIPFIIAIALIAAWILAYWFRRAGISDPRLLNFTLIGISIEVVSVIIGGLFMPHIEMNLAQHLFNHVIARGALVGIGSLVSSAVTYVTSVLPGNFEGDPEPSRNFTKAEFNNPSYYSQWTDETNTWQHYG